MKVSIASVVLKCYTTVKAFKKQISGFARYSTFIVHSQTLYQKYTSALAVYCRYLFTVAATANISHQLLFDQFVIFRAADTASVIHPSTKLFFFYKERKVL